MRLRRRLFATLCILSLLACSVAVFLWVCGYSVTDSLSFPWKVDAQGDAETSVTVYSARGLLVLKVDRIDPRPNVFAVAPRRSIPRPKPDVGFVHYRGDVISPELASAWGIAGFGRGTYAFVTGGGSANRAGQRTGISSVLVVPWYAVVAAVALPSLPYLLGCGRSRRRPDQTPGGPSRRHPVLTFVAGLALLLCVAVCALWAGSWAPDAFYRATPGGGLWEVRFDGGGVAVIRAAPWPRAEAARWEHGPGSIGHQFFTGGQAVAPLLTARNAGLKKLLDLEAAHRKAMANLSGAPAATEERRIVEEVESLRRRTMSAVLQQDFRIAQIVDSTTVGLKAPTSMGSTGTATPIAASGAAGFTDMRGLGAHAGGGPAWVLLPPSQTGSRWAPNAQEYPVSLRFVRVDYQPLAIVLGVPPLVWLVCRCLASFRCRRLEGKGLCPSCGYDLRASKNRCPECGTPISISPATSQ